MALFRNASPSLSSSSSPLFFWKGYFFPVYARAASSAKEGPAAPAGAEWRRRSNYLASCTSTSVLIRGGTATTTTSSIAFFLSFSQLLTSPHFTSLPQPASFRAQLLLSSFLLLVVVLLSPFIMHAATTDRPLSRRGVGVGGRRSGEGPWPGRPDTIWGLAAAFHSFFSPSLRSGRALPS